MALMSTQKSGPGTSGTLWMLEPTLNAPAYINYLF